MLGGGEMGHTRYEWEPGSGLTQLIPQLPALVCHAGTLLPPQGQARVLQELLGHED